MTDHAVIQEGHRQQPQVERYSNAVKTFEMNEMERIINSGTDDMVQMRVELHDS